MRVHIIGLAGSGKSTLARALARPDGIPAFDLDWTVYDGDTRAERPPHEIERRIRDIALAESWITEGAYHSAWLNPLLERADAIIWLDLPLRVCIYRMVKRHVAAELRRNNPHPGWRRLLNFLNYTRRSAAEQRAETRALLRPYAPRAIRSASPRDLAALRVRLQTSRRRE